MQHRAGPRLLQRQHVRTRSLAAGHNRRHRASVAAVKAAADIDHEHSSSTGSTAKRVVILGGTGRVGASTAAALLQDYPQGLHLVLASRSQRSYEKACQRRPELAAATFVSCDIDDSDSLARTFQGADLVVHAAGPFQRKPGCKVLEAAIASGTAYMDVCDDADYSQRAKGYSGRAAAAGVPAITSAGIYPGTSNVMAAHMIAMARKEYDEEWRYRAQGAEGGVEPRRLLYSYYTAGSGGVGPTILETSLLLAGEPVVCFKDGRKVIAPPISNRRVVNFGTGLGRKSVYLYNLPEVESSHACMRVPNVSARFGTDPEIWNWAMWLVARLAPKGFLEDRGKAKWLAAVADPLVRLVDPLIGEKVAMLVEVELENGQIAAGLYVHKLLSDAVGICIGAFARAMLEGETAPGVWFPEEQEALKDRRGLLKRSVRGCSNFALNKPTWLLESEPTQLGFGMYW